MRSGATRHEVMELKHQPELAIAMATLGPSAKDLK